MQITKITAAFVGFALAVFYGGMPAMAAGNVVVETTNSADIINVAEVKADTGDNVSRGGDGGDVSSSRSRSRSGNGGDGGNGGSITTGTAISTSVISNEVNTTRTSVRQAEDCGCDVYDTRLEIRADEGATESYDHDKRWRFDAEWDSEHEASSTYSQSEESYESESDNNHGWWHKGGEESEDYSSSGEYYNEEESSSHQGSMSKSGSESESYDSDEGDSLRIVYEKTYAGDRASTSNVRVANSNNAGLENYVEVKADTGDNKSAGGAGGDVSGSSYSGSRHGHSYYRGGLSSDGGNGGNGSSVRTGIADSRSDIINVVNTTVTRVR